MELTLLGLAAATLVSEDGACAAAGALIAGGTVNPAGALAACWAGIVAGDLLLFLGGRWMSHTRLLRARLASFWSTTAGRRLARGRERGLPLVLMAVRFLPGARLPTYVAAGALGARFAVFATWVSLGAAGSTILLVGLAAAAAGAASSSAGGAHGSLWALAGAVGVLALARLVQAAFSWRTRRKLLGAWRRLTRWEFWPPWVFYAPVALRVLGLAVKHRSLTLFTAANPAIPTGGFAGESKSAILEALEASGAPLATFVRLRSAAPADERLRLALEFVEGRGGGMPVVLKPDRGQRGAGVQIVRDAVTLVELVRRSGADMILQAYVPGPELGIFYVREPGAEHGRIFSITVKVLPELTGDGRRSLERLILDDDRAVCMSAVYLHRLRERLDEVPAPGARVGLAEIGNHCRGALFLDGSHLGTPALEQRIDAISRAYEGFNFGRYDVKAPSLDHFREGRGLSILELNGAGSESTDIYDPGNSLLSAYRRLFEQWRLAFEIGRANRMRGATPSRLRDVARAIL